jgi:hypothetical protein
MSERDELLRKKSELNFEKSDINDTSSEESESQWIVPEELPERIRVKREVEEIPEEVPEEAKIPELDGLGKETEVIQEFKNEQAEILQSSSIIGGGKSSEKLERDILLERLERKLAEKEKEVEELRRMLNEGNIEEKIEEIKTGIKNELLNEILIELKRELIDLNKVKELEAKVVELSKTVESIMSEVLYLKAELRKEIEKPEKVESRKYRSKTEEMSAEGEEIEEDQVEEELIEEEEEIIVCD